MTMDEQTLLESFQVEVPGETKGPKELSKEPLFFATMPLTELKQTQQQVRVPEEETPNALSSESSQTLTLQCIKEKLSNFVAASSPLHRGKVLLHGAGHLMHVPESALVWIDAQIWDNLVHSLLDWNQYLTLASFIVFVDSWATEKSLELKLKAQASMAIAEGRCQVAWMIDPSASKMRVYTQGCLPSPKKVDDSWKSLKAETLFPGFEVTPKELDSAIGRETVVVAEPVLEMSSSPCDSISVPEKRALSPEKVCASEPAVQKKARTAKWDHQGNDHGQAFSNGLMDFDALGRMHDSSRSCSPEVPEHPQGPSPLDLSFKPLSEKETKLRLLRNRVRIGHTPPLSALGELSMTDIKRDMRRKGPMEGFRGLRYTKVDLEEDTGKLILTDEHAAAKIGATEYLYKNIQAFVESNPSIGGIVMKGEELKEYTDVDVESYFDLCWFDQQSYNQLTEGSLDVSRIHESPQFAVKVDNFVNDTMLLSRLETQIEFLMIQGLCRLFWLIDPVAKEVKVYDWRNEMFYKCIGEDSNNLSGGFILPGLLISKDEFYNAALCDCAQVEESDSDIEEAAESAQSHHDTEVDGSAKIAKKKVGGQQGKRTRGHLSALVRSNETDDSDEKRRNIQIMLKMALKGRPANLANLNLSLVDVKRYLSRNGPISGPHGESFVRAEMVDGGDLEFKNNQTPSLFDLLNLVYNSLDCYLRRDGAPAGRLIRSGEDLDFFDENYDGTIESRFPDICWVEEESWKQLKSGDIELTQIPLLAKFGVKLMTPLFGVPAWMRQRQIADCMQRGSYEIIWLLDPFGKTMSVYRKAEDGFKFDSDLPWKSLDGGSLFPGFKLDVSLIDLSLLGDCFDWSTVSACDWCHQRLNHLPAMQSVQYVLDEGGMSLEPLVVDVPLEVEYHSEELQTPPRIENSSPITSLSRIDTYSGENGRPAPFVPDSPVHLVDLDETDAKPEKRRRSGTVAETKPVKGSRRKSGSRPSVEDQEHKEELMELMAETVTKGDPVNLKVLGITMEDVLKHMEMYGPWYGPNGTKLIKLYLDDESNLQFGEQVLESKRGVMNLLEPLITAYTKYKSLPGHVYCDMEEIEARIYKEDDESRLEPDLLWFDEETWESMTDLERATPSVRALKAQFILLVANYEADAALETLREEKIDLFFTQGNCKLLWFVDSLEVDHVCEFRKSKSARGYTRRGKQLEGGDVFPGLLILEKIVKKAAIQDCGHYLGTIYSCTHCPLLFMSERGQYIHEMGEHTGVMKTTARRRKSVPR